MSAKSSNNASKGINFSWLAKKPFPQKRRKRKAVCWIVSRDYIEKIWLGYINYQWNWVRLDDYDDWRQDRPDPPGHGGGPDGGRADLSCVITIIFLFVCFTLSIRYFYLPVSGTARPCTGRWWRSRRRRRISLKFNYQIYFYIIF